MKGEIPGIQAVFRKGRRTRDQIANIHQIIEKAGEFQENIYFWFTDYAKPLTVCIIKNCGKFLKRWEYHHLTFLLRTLYSGQEAIVRTGHRTTDWFLTGKGIHQGCVLSSCLFNLHAEYIMRNSGLDESHVGIKIARRDINNLRYADDTTLMAESKEYLKSLLMRVKEDYEKAGLKVIKKI